MWRADKDGVYLGEETTPRITCFKNGIAPDEELAKLVRDALNEHEWREGRDRTPPEGVAVLPVLSEMNPAERYERIVMIEDLGVLDSTT